MAGVKLDVYSDIEIKLAGLADAVENKRALFAQVNEYLHRIHRDRFARQETPEGDAWEALSPAYAKRKHRNADKILTFRGYLQGTLRGQYDDASLEFGTDRTYGAIQHYGGTIRRQARQQTMYFRQGRDGSVGNQFVRRSRSNFAQTANVGPYEITIPSRRWLGVGPDERSYLVSMTIRYLSDAVGAHFSL